MNIGILKRSFKIDLHIGLDTEEDFRAFRQILTQWLDDHCGNSNSVTAQNAKSIARNLLGAISDDST